MPDWCSTDKLRSGDILLLLDEPSNTTWKHQLIKPGQRLVSSPPILRTSWPSLTLTNLL
jgi:hypothetical protein